MLWIGEEGGKLVNECKNRCGLLGRKDGTFSRGLIFFFEISGILWRAFLKKSHALIVEKNDIAELE